MALQDFFEDLVMVDRKTASDGLGGFGEIFTDGAVFQGAITTNQSMETRIAQAQGVTSVYTIITPKNVSIRFNDIVKRKKDNTYYRITSNPLDMETPLVANISYYQMTAENFILPN